MSFREAHEERSTGPAAPAAKAKPREVFHEVKNKAADFLVTFKVLTKMTTSKSQLYGTKTK